MKKFVFAYTLSHENDGCADTDPCVFREVRRNQFDPLWFSC